MFAVIFGALRDMDILVLNVLLSIYDMVLLIDSQSIQTQTKYFHFKLSLPANNQV